MTPDESSRRGSHAEVLCAGIIVADAIASPVDRAPEPGVVNLVDSVQLATGGCALSTATALARLGGRTALCGCVGQDLLGQVLLGEAASRGLDTGGVRVCDELTSASLVLDRSDGERTFLHNPGASGALTREDIERALAHARPRWLHIGGALVMPALDGEPLARALAAARERGVVTSLDPVHDATGRALSTTAVGASTALPDLEGALSFAGLEREPAA
jgi:sugar/nucleoside kinase (ribokinase family)